MTVSGASSGQMPLYHAIVINGYWEQQGQMMISPAAMQAALEPIKRLRIVLQGEDPEAEASRDRC